MATVEFAICLPLLVAVSLGSIEACNAIYLKQVATEAAYESVRVASGSSGTMLTSEARAQEILAAHGINDGVIEFSPVSESSWTRGVDVTVTVKIPSSNLGTVNFYVKDQLIQGRLIMVKQ